MADIFISYKREDRPIAERLSIALEQMGFDTWWDFDLLSGDRYRSVIRAVIDQCKAAIVLWSVRAVESDFVMDEATYAKGQGKLCPARIDNVDLPFGFGSVHTNDLSDWDGEMSHPGFQALVRAIEARVGRKGRLGARPSQSQTTDAELEAFKAAQLAGNTSALRAYLKTFPRGTFANFVRGQLEGMQAEARTASAAQAIHRDPPRAPAPPPPPDRPPPRPSAYVESLDDEPEEKRKDHLARFAIIGIAIVVLVGLGYAALSLTRVNSSKPEEAVKERSIYDADVPSTTQRPSRRAARTGPTTQQAASSNSDDAASPPPAGVSTTASAPTSQAQTTTPYDLSRLAPVVRDAVERARLAAQHGREAAQLAQTEHRGYVVRTSESSRYQGQGSSVAGMTASGMTSFRNGDAYEGDYLSGNPARRHGFGVYQLADGSRYEGAWQADLRSGYGVLWDRHGALVRSGLWRNNELASIVTPPEN